MLASLVLNAFAAIQGAAVVVRVPGESSAAAAELSWQDQRVAMTYDGSAWTALIGVDLDVAPGTHDLIIDFELANGVARRQIEHVEVAAGEYPETHLEVERRYVELNPADQERAAREARRIASLYAARSAHTDWQQPFAAPLRGVSGGRNFGHRRFFNGQPRNPHSGADLRAAEGTPVFTANGGQVVLADALFFSGKAVFVDHGAGVVSVYLHLSQIEVGEGDRVEQGQQIGLAGATGRVTGPHLHWGIRVLDARVDPFTLPGLSNNEGASDDSNRSQ